MKKTRTWILGAILLASLAAVASYAQQTPAVGMNKEAMAVVDKMIVAMGGRKVLESIKDTTISGTAEIVQFGITVPITIYQKEPNKMRMDITIAEANMTIIQAFDGQKGWYTNPQSGSTEEMPDFMAKEMARQAGQNQALLFPLEVQRHLRPEAQGRDRGQGLHRPRADPGRRPQDNALPRSGHLPALQDRDADPRPERRRGGLHNVLDQLPEGRRHHSPLFRSCRPERLRRPAHDHHGRHLQHEPGRRLFHLEVIGRLPCPRRNSLHVSFFWSPRRPPAP